MKLGRITANFAIVAPTGIALKGFTRLWDDVCTAVETQAAGATQTASPYVAGAPAATGYITIQDSAGVTYKILVST